MVLVDPRRFAKRVGTLAVVGFALFGFISGQVANATDTKAEQVHYSVHAGDTLWKIAAELAPNQDPRDWIAQVVSLNALTQAEVQPGQQIALP